LIRTFFLVILLLLSAQQAEAQQSTLRNLTDVKTFSEGFMNLVGSGKYDEAFKRARSIIILPLAELDAAAAQANSQMPQIQPRVGKPRGYEFLREQKVGESLVRHQYIAKHEKFAIRWNFVFYNNGSGWVLAEFKFDTNISSLFPGEA
jgi:hypothetical protein